MFIQAAAAEPSVDDDPVVAKSELAPQKSGGTLADWLR